MAKASDNQYPYVHLVPAVAPANPTAGERLYLDSADGNKLKRRSTAGVVTTVEGAGTAIGVGAYSTTATSIPNGVETIVPLSLESFDTAAFHDLVTNNSRVTVPAGLAGYYTVVAQVAYAYNATGSRTCALLLNGVKTAEVGGTAVAQSVPTLPYIAYLNVGDYLQMATYQDSGAARTLQTTGNTKLTVIRLGT